MNLLLIFSVLLIGAQTTSQYLPESELSNNFPKPRIACGPWIQAAGETEFTVVWETNVPCISWVEVAPDDGTNFYVTERPKYYESWYGRRPVTTLHHVRIKDLQCGTAYRYRIFQQALLLDEGNKRMVFGEAYGNDFNFTKIEFKIKTLDSSRPESRFTMVNDTHGNDSLFRQLTKDVVKNKNNFVIFNGDMLSQIESSQQIVDGYMKSASELFSPFTPIFAVRGNHEHRGSASYDYMRWFPTSTSEPYYTFRDGPAFFIALDCGEDKPDSDIRYYGLSLTDQLREEQAEWLKQIITTDEFKSALVKIVILHIPPYPNGGQWHGTHEIERLFMPILNNAGIDLMLSGHLHKHYYLEKGAAGNNFPILINSNKTRLDAIANKNGIDLKIVDANGKILHNYLIPQ
ncbi:FN3 domain-containing metallophosphoesterase family protein [Proteiniphilum sp. UBA5384]|uniref:FN3 domain-containing metallophosphoesterase family protein n=1 Tax=Proteiniphilum sp. UBA5384 TaxID=1947279 RepID=UPI0025EFEB26|nr:FN3 domain-containing metallophosphoesterase family protein [Proteiniphilum sp. UBA5384]